VSECIIRRLAAWSLTIASLLAVAACGSSSSSSGSGGAAASSGGSAGPSSGGASTLNIGVIYPFTGANADQGAVGMAGCLSGIAQVNQAGGVLGHKLACKPFDTKGDPADAVPAANQMMASASPVMVIGASDDAVATAPIVTGQHVVNFATIGDPRYDTQTNPFFYRLTPSDALQGVALGYWAAHHGQTHAAAAFTSDLGAQTSVPPLRTEYAKLGGKFTSDVKLAPGQSSYRTEVSQIINSHPDAIISEMDPQSSTTFLSEYKQLAGNLPEIIGTERTSNSDWIQAVLGGIGESTFAKSLRSITPYVSFSGAGYDLYKKQLLSLGSRVKNPDQYVGHPYAISDFDAVAITALAMTMAKSTSPGTYNADVTKVTAPGGTVVHTYAEGLAALKSGKQITYVGASGPLVFNKYHSAGRAFSYDDYDPANKSMKAVTVIPGTALNGG
jgi:branched-chain amino acid transport system substrate-binding protein